MNLSAAFRARILQVHGERGRTWVAGLPELIRTCERRLDIKVQPPFAGLSYNFVAPAVRADGEQVVLKLGVPNAELSSEVRALQCMRGAGVVRLLAADAENGVLLLERLHPGKCLTDGYTEEQSVHAAAEVMLAMWAAPPAGHAFRSVLDWGRGFERLRETFGGGSGPFPADLVDRAEDLFRQLSLDAEPQVLLHGDLHHDNILSAQRADWLAIDPKGVLGERAYEIGAFLRNPIVKIGFYPDLEQVLARRIDQFASELGLDRARIHGWGLAQAMLSAWWQYEDHGSGWDTALACAGALAAC